MGLSNAPSTFQGIVNEIFADEIKEGFLSVYLDDLLIHSESADEHCVHLERILAKLKASNLFAT